MIESLAYTNRVKFPAGFLMVISGLLLTLAFLQNGIYLSFCIAVLLVILKILWRFNMPGILPFTLGMQWLQVFAYVLWMNVIGRPIEYYSPSAPNALIFASLGLLVMAIVINKGVSGLQIYQDESFLKTSKHINEKKLLILYLFSTLFLSSIGFIFGTTSGFAQVLVTVSSLKWLFFMWYACLVWINKKNKLILLLLLGYEFTSGIYSYFSSFKDVIYFAIIISLTFIKQITFRQIIYLILTASFLIALLLVWSAIKGDYREFLNGGQRQQIITVSKEQAFSRIGENIQKIDSRRLEVAMNLSLYRLQYLYHLAIVMDRVPKVIPYQEGKIWWENVSFVFTPRILFPDKPIYEATVKTNKYTGFHYAGLKKGASFSLGYFADSYVDFGYIGMFVPLILMALFVVLIFRTFYKMDQLDLLFRFSIINVTLYNFTNFESDGLFLFGRLLTNFLVFWALSKTLFPVIQKWLYKKESE